MPPPQPRPGNPFIADVANFQAPEFSGAREAGRSIVAGAGAVMNDRNVNTVMQQFRQVGGQMSGQNMEMFMRTTMATAQQSGMTYNELLQMGHRGGQVGGQMGFDPRIGMATALQSASFGRAYQERAGPSSLSGAQARQLDQELRLAAAQSPMANMLGSAMAMSEAGLLRGRSVNIGGQNVNLGALAGNDQNARNAALSQLASLNPAQFVDTMRQAGISPDTASQFLGAQNANRDQIARHGVQDVVRTQQRQEVRNMMAEEMSGAFSPALRRAGVRDVNARRSMSMAAGSAIQSAMEAMNADPNARNLTPEQRNQRLAGAARQALAGSGLDEAQVNQLTAGAVRSMEERVRADPNLQRFGDVQGLLNMNRADIVGAGMAGANAAQAAAGNQQRAVAGGQRDPAVVAAEAAAANANRPPGPPGGQPGGQPTQQPDPAEVARRQTRINELRTRLNIAQGGAGDTGVSILQERARTAEGRGALTEEQNELVRLTNDQQTASRAAAAAAARGGQGGQGGGAAGAGGANQQRIQITGTLIVRADGSAIVDAEGGLPVNE